MTDLISRLRARTSPLALEAADEIERLQAEIARREAAVLAGPGSARRTDPDTSHSAAKLFNKENNRRRLLEAYAAAYPEGLTAEEASEAAGILTKSASPMRRAYDLYKSLPDLGDRPMCEETGETRPSKSGATMKVHRITIEGRNWLATHPL